MRERRAHLYFMFSDRDAKLIDVYDMCVADRALACLLEIRTVRLEIQGH